MPLSRITSRSSPRRLRHRARDCERLCHEGAGVVLLDANETAAANVAKKSRRPAGEAVSYLLDVTRRDDASR